MFDLKVSIDQDTPPREVALLAEMLAALAAIAMRRTGSAEPFPHALQVPPQSTTAPVEAVTGPLAATDTDLATGQQVPAGAPLPAEPAKPRGRGRPPKADPVAAYTAAGGKLPTEEPAAPAEPVEEPAAPVEPPVTSTVESIVQPEPAEEPEAAEPAPTVDKQTLVGKLREHVIGMGPSGVNWLREQLTQRGVGGMSALSVEQLHQVIALAAKVEQAA